MKNTSKSGFTLIELMTVVVIIAVVAGITMASASYLVRNARRQRARVTCRTLEAALSRYRHEYKEWPGIPTSVGEGIKAVTFLGTKNADVFSPLRETHPANADSIRFLDESAMLTAQGWDKPTKTLAETAESTAQPLAYRAPKNGYARFFRVTINLDDDTAKVEMDDSFSNTIATEARN